MPLANKNLIAGGQGRHIRADMLDNPNSLIACLTLRKGKGLGKMGVCGIALVKHGHFSADADEAV